MGYGAPRGKRGTELQQGPEYGRVCDHLPQMDAPGEQEAHHSRGSWREEESIRESHSRSSEAPLLRRDECVGFCMCVKAP